MHGWMHVIYISNKCMLIWYGNIHQGPALKNVIWRHTGLASCTANQWFLSESQWGQHKMYVCVTITQLWPYPDTWKYFLIVSSTLSYKCVLELQHYRPIQFQESDIPSISNYSPLGHWSPPWMGDHVWCWSVREYHSMPALTNPYAHTIQVVFVSRFWTIPHWWTVPHRIKIKLPDIAWPGIPTRMIPRTTSYQTNINW